MWIGPYLAKEEDEKRMIVKQIIQSNADIFPDYINKTLMVTLHSFFWANRLNNAVYELALLYCFLLLLVEKTTEKRENKGQ